MPCQRTSDLLNYGTTIQIFMAKKELQAAIWPQVSWFCKVESNKMRLISQTISRLNKLLSSNPHQIQRSVRELDSSSP